MRKRRPLVALPRALVWERCRGRCEHCGKPLSALDYECHHRKLRAQGGDWSVTNLLALHYSCHNAAFAGAVHNTPVRSYDLGYLVRGAFDPAEMPVLLHGKKWVLLTPTGQYTPCEETP
jgi:HNH endonuclease